MPRFRLAFVLVGLVGLLAAGALVLALFQSPTASALAVHNGAGETLSASRVVGQYTGSDLNGDVISFVFTAPDYATEVARGPHGALKGKRSVEGTTALGVLEPVRLLLSMTTFRQEGSRYIGTIPLTDILPASERGLVSGSYDATAHITTGFVVALVVDIDATEAGHHLSERIRYRFEDVGSWERG